MRACHTGLRQWMTPSLNDSGASTRHPKLRSWNGCRMSQASGMSNGWAKLQLPVSSGGLWSHGRGLALVVLQSKLPVPHCMQVSGLCTWVSLKFNSFQRIHLLPLLSFFHTGWTLQCDPSGEQGTASQNVAGEMLSQSHDKRLTRWMNCLSKQEYTIYTLLHWKHKCLVSGLESEATPNACVIHVMYAEEQQAQRHRPPWPGDYVEAVPGNSPGEGPGAMWSAGQLCVVFQPHSQASPALYACLVSSWNSLASAVWEENFKPGRMRWAWNICTHLCTASHVRLRICAKFAAAWI